MAELSSGSEVEVGRRVHPCPVPQNGNIKLPYGMAPNGRLLHISEVEKGLACACVCPSCSGKLVAHKGPKNTHHFAHHSEDRNCVAAYETMLHKLAKQVIEYQKQVMLPRVVAEYKGFRENIRPKRMFTLDEVVIEPYLEGMRPDILGRIRVNDGPPKELLIEVAVTHPCEEKKQELIRERKVAAIEIDLSKVPRNGSQEDMEQAIITAPRKWLFNPLEQNAIEQLQAEFERKADAERKREEHRRQQQKEKLDEQADQLAERFRTIRTVPPGLGSPADEELVDLVLDTSLRDLVDIEVPGNPCFTVAARVWRVATLNWLILDQSSRRPNFETEDALKRLRKQGLVRPLFAMHISGELADAVRSREADFNSPGESIQAYLDHLAAQRIIIRQYGRWHRNEQAAREARMLLQDRADGRRRVAQLEERIKSLGGERGLDVEQWMNTQHRGLADSPAALAMAGGGNYDKLDMHIRRLEHMRDPGAYPEEDLLGLPLEKEQQARREEKRLAREKVEQERAERARKAAEETRQANVRRRKELVELLVDSAGEIEVEDWMINRPLQSLGGISINLLAEVSEEQKHAAFRELMDERNRQQKELLQKATVNDLQYTLRTEAQRHRGVEWVDVWMRAMNSDLKNQRPCDVCVDKAGLEKCREALKVEIRRRRR